MAAPAPAAGSPRSPLIATKPILALHQLEKRASAIISSAATTHAPSPVARRQNVFDIAKGRCGWLVMFCLGLLLSALIVQRFEDLLEHHVQLRYVCACTLAVSHRHQRLWGHHSGPHHRVGKRCCCTKGSRGQRAPIPSQTRRRLEALRPSAAHGRVPRSSFHNSIGLRGLTAEPPVQPAAQRPYLLRLCCELGRVGLY